MPHYSLLHGYIIILVLSFFLLINSLIIIFIIFCVLLSVCKAFVDEAEAEIEKIDPHKKVDVGSFRLDGKGNVKQNLVL